VVVAWLALARAAGAESENAAVVPAVGAGGVPSLATEVVLNGASHRVAIGAGDEPVATALAFCRRHGLEPVDCTRLADELERLQRLSLDNNNNVAAASKPPGSSASRGDHDDASPPDGDGAASPRSAAAEDAPRRADAAAPPGGGGIDYSRRVGPLLRVVDQRDGGPGAVPQQHELSRYAGETRAAAVRRFCLRVRAAPGDADCGAIDARYAALEGDAAEATEAAEATPEAAGMAAAEPSRGEEEHAGARGGAVNSGIIVNGGGAPESGKSGAPPADSAAATASPSPATGLPQQARLPEWARAARRHLGERWQSYLLAVLLVIVLHLQQREQEARGEDEAFQDGGAAQAR